MHGMPTGICIIQPQNARKKRIEENVANVSFFRQTIGRALVVLRSVY